MQYQAIMRQEDFAQLEQKLNSIEALLENLQQGAAETYLDNEAFMKKMGVSKRTVQTWRDNGIIPFSQIGHKIYYKAKDVDAMIDKYYINFKDNKYGVK